LLLLTVSRLILFAFRILGPVPGFFPYKNTVFVLCCMKLLYAVLVLLIVPFVHATQLGVNYYHETMMTDLGELYVPRTLEQVGSDMDDIRSVTTHVKFFANPFYDNNVAWTAQVNDIAKAKGMHTSITFLADRQTLTAENWDDYANRVVAACTQFSGKVDVIFVGNEITLRSPLPKEDIKNRVVDLMARCKQVFPGEVSYQEFWHARDAWKDYDGTIYFMMYENFDSFKTNMGDLQREFPSAGIGEWGEDLWEDQVQHDEAWQADQIRQRWDIIQAANVPVAYLFTYREPTFNSFGIVRYDGSHRPIWGVFGAASTPAQSCTPVAEYYDGMDNNCDGKVDEGFAEGPNPTGNTTQPPAVNSSTDGSQTEVPVDAPKKKRSGGGSSRVKARATRTPANNTTLLPEVAPELNVTVPINDTNSSLVQAEEESTRLSARPETSAVVMPVTEKPQRFVFESQRQQSYWGRFVSWLARLF
jgi:hypothetical protein